MKFFSVSGDIFWWEWLHLLVGVVTFVGESGDICWWER